MPNCAAGADDAARAAAERAHVKAKLESSLTLVPYKAVKLLTRSKGAANRPAAWEKLDGAIDATAALPSGKLTPDEAKTAAQAYGALAVALVQAKGELHGHDEDEYPLLWDTFVKKPLPAFWYDNGGEHLALSTAWVVLDIADGATTKKLPAHDVIFYEADRASTGEKWPREARAWSQLLSGVAYAHGEHRYAAEEDLTKYLAALESEPVSAPLTLAKLTIPAADAQKGLRASGHFARAWNRMGMNRDDGAAADLKEGLKDLEGLGIDNELTQWAWAFVHAQQGNFEESAAQLTKLAASPNIDDATRAEILADAATMRTTKKKVPILSNVKAGAILSQALLRRVGGVRGLIDVVTGNEEAAKGIEWLRASRDGLAQNVTGAAKDLAGSKLDAIKQAVKQLTDAGPN